MLNIALPITGKVAGMGFKVLDIVRFFKGLDKMSTMNGIHSSGAFRDILDREVSRAERTGQIFSLVVFGIEKGNGTDAASLERLGHALGQKVRRCDEVGWYDGDRIGTILPGTSAEGAWQFAEIVKERIKDEAPRMTCAIYSYPSSWMKSDARQTDSKEAQAPFPAGKSIEPPGKLFARPIPMGKQLIDFYGAFILVILLSPIFLFISLLIKIVSPGPVIFRQERIGYKGRPFTLWKFRTMHVDNNADVHVQHINNAIASDTPITKLDEMNDNRIIPFGKFLRSSCLDELPQLFNVLLGDMSLVGPRPCMAFEAEKLLQWQTRRFDTLPGMSGLWQVSGKNRMTFKEMTRFDIRYSRKLSPALDAKIMLVTVPAIVGMVIESRTKKKAIKRESAKMATLHRDLHIQG